MHLKTLVLNNFRNYDHLEVSFDEKVNLFIGDNGMGKTNLLEAIHLLSTGRSFKTNKLTDLIQDGKSYFFIKALFEKEGVEQSLQIGYEKNSKKIEYNSTKLEAFSHILGIIPSTLYCPKDLELITGTPSERRRFLNVLLAQNDPLYVYHLLRYTKALKQRNVLLKTKKTLGIECFEKEMSLSGAYITKARKTTLEKLNIETLNSLKKLSFEDSSYTLSYAPSIPMKQDTVESSFLSQLLKLREKELILSSTLTGPHRDDISIFQNNKLAKDFASEGQKRSLVASLKHAEWTMLHSKHFLKPLMCVDDFGVHLDQTRKLAFEKSLTSFGQVFITMPKNELTLKPGKLFEVSHGRLNII